MYSVRNNLLKQYPQTEVDEVINIFTKQQQEFQLRNYVNSQLALGFKPEMIRSNLMQRGYSQDLIDSVFNGGNSGSITVRHEIHFPLKTIIILLLLIGVGGAGFWFFTNSTDNALLDVSIQSHTQEYIAGHDVSYSVELVNMGKSKRFDANIRYTITDDSGKVLKSYSETLAVETKATQNGKITLPSSIQPGTYNLNAIVTYGNDKKAESSTEFQIVTQITPPASGGGTGTSGGTTGGSSTSGGTTTGGSSGSSGITPGTSTGGTSGGTTPTTTPSSPREKSFGASMNLIRQQAVTNPQAAINACLKFKNSDQKDICVGEIAYSTNRVNYCDQIESAEKRDNCYLTFMIGGNTQMCDKITDTNTKQYCNQMKIVTQMNYYYQQGDNDKVLELSKQFEPAIYNTNPIPRKYENAYNQESSIDMSDFTLTGELD